MPPVCPTLHTYRKQLTVLMIVQYIVPSMGKARLGRHSGAARAPGGCFSGREASLAGGGVRPADLFVTALRVAAYSFELKINEAQIVRAVGDVRTAP